jgi:phosphoglycerate dehydrogenase-like enzyme
MSEKKKILLDTHFRRTQDIFSEEDWKRLHDLADVEWAENDPVPAAEVEKVQNELYAIISGGWRYGNVDKFKNLHAVMDVGGRHPGPEELDYPYCFSHGIRVLTISPVFGPMVAEMALGMALSASREIAEGDRLFRKGEEIYLRFGNQTTFTLYNQQIGFIGFGALARSLKELLAPFHCSIQVYDPWLPESYLLRHGVTPVDLDTLLSTSRIVFVLAIPTEENKHMLSGENLSLLPDGAVLVIISRAHLVDFDALTKEVKTNRIKAAIDVFPEEPLPKDHPIRQAEKAVLSAHRAGSVLQDLRLIGTMVVNDLETMLAGLPPTEMLVAEPEFIKHLTKTW